MNDQGIWIHDHEGKAGLLWNSFRNRMGTTSSPTMLFDLSSLVTSVNELDSLAAPILQEEVDLVVKRMPADKAPGPDGFNGRFLKKC
jgi:hypothetical protein